MVSIPPILKRNVFDRPGREGVGRTFDVVSKPRPSRPRAATTARCGGSCGRAHQANFAANTVSAISLPGRNCAQGLSAEARSQGGRIRPKRSASARSANAMLSAGQTAIAPMERARAGTARAPSLGSGREAATAAPVIAARELGQSSRTYSCGRSCPAHRRRRRRSPGN